MFGSTAHRTLFFGLEKIERKEVMKMNLEQFKKAMSDGSISGGSSHKMRNEDIQSKQRGAKYPFVKKENGKLSKLLIPKELAFDFNPFTGEQDEQFNAQNKFRPMMSATAVAKIVKEAANTVSETKDRLMTKAGVSEWDTSDFSVINDVDMLIFKPWVYTQIFTLSVFNTTLRALSDKAWGVNYLVNVNRDPISGSVVGDVPVPLQISYLCSALAHEEISEYESKCTKGEIAHTEEQKKEFKRNVFQKRILVGQDQPYNLVRLYEIPIEDYEATAKTIGGGATVDKLKEFVRVSRYSSELENAITNFVSGNNKKFDTNFDFFELDMSCPVNAADEKELGKNTRYEKAAVPLNSSDFGKNILKCAIEERDLAGDVESIMYTSARVRVYNDDVEAKILEAASVQIDLNDNYMTDNVVKGNKEIIGLIFQEEGYIRIEAAEGGFSGKSEGVYTKEVDQNIRQEISNIDFNEMLADEVETV